MATIKAVNFTPAAALSILNRYVAGGSGMESADFDKRDAIVKELAVEFKGDDSTSSIRSIRSKLTSMKNKDGEKVYIARKTVSGVTGKEPVKKDIMAKNLVETAGDTSGVAKAPLNAASIEKMNKPEIDTLTMFIASLHSQIADLEDELVSIVSAESENDSNK